MAVQKSPGTDACDELRRSSQGQLRVLKSRPDGAETRASRTPKVSTAKSSGCQFRFHLGGLASSLQRFDPIKIGTSVQTLIDQFELMAMANAAPAAPRSWSVSGSSKTALPAASPKSDNSAMRQLKKTAEIYEAAEPAEEETLVAKPTTPTQAAVYKTLTVKTTESDDEDDAKTFNLYDDDADSTTTTKSTCYLTVPPSPSSYSTTSTGSLDSLLSSLDMFLPELLQASGETSAEISKIAKPTVYRSRRSSLPENLQSSTTASKLVPPISYRRASLTEKSSSVTTKDVAPTAPKSRRSLLYAAKNTAPVAATPRRSSLSATMAPPAAKSTRRFSESARGAPPVVTSLSPRARSRSSSSSVPRYMDYNSSPRFAATKARNMERRRQLEERNRNLAADKAKHLSSKTARRPRTPEWQGCLDQVRSRLFDSKEDSQSYTFKAKVTASRRHSTSSHSRV